MRRSICIHYDIRYSEIVFGDAGSENPRLSETPVLVFRIDARFGKASKHRPQAVLY